MDKKSWRWLERIVMVILSPIILCAAVCLCVGMILTAILTIVGEWLSAKRAREDDNKTAVAMLVLPDGVDTVYQHGHDDFGW